MLGLYFWMLDVEDSAYMVTLVKEPYALSKSFRIESIDSEFYSLFSNFMMFKSTAVSSMEFRLYSEIIS